MKRGIWFAGAALLALAACETNAPMETTPANEFLETLPEGVLAIAAPGQDLSAVKIDPLDGCYVYRYVGPVETTFLPLRTIDGRPICSRPPEPTDTGAPSGAV